VDQHQLVLALERRGAVQEQELAKAKELAERCLTVDGEYTQGKLLMGQILLAGGNIEEAEKIFVGLTGAGSEALNALGEALEKAGKD